MIFAYQHYTIGLGDYLVGRNDNPFTNVYLPAAEQKFFSNPKTWQSLKDMYNHDKTNNLYNNAVLLRTCEFIRDNKNDIK